MLAIFFSNEASGFKPADAVERARSTDGINQSACRSIISEPVGATSCVSLSKSYLSPLKSHRTNFSISPKGPLHHLPDSRGNLELLLEGLPSLRMGLKLWFNLLHTCAGHVLR